MIEMMTLMGKIAIVVMKMVKKKCDIDDGNDDFYADENDDFNGEHGGFNGVPSRCFDQLGTGPVCKIRHHYQAQEKSRPAPLRPYDS